MSAVLVNVSREGNSLLARYDDGSSRWLYPTTSGFWIPGVHHNGVSDGSGGEYPGVPPTGSTPGSVAAAVDDYPWPNAPEDSLSPLRYSYRDCTDFVAWRCNRDVGCTSAPWQYTWGNLRWQGTGGNGNAIGWRDDWAKYGRGVDLPAAAGTIGWYGSKAGPDGHVNYVQSVASDGTIHVEEYNWAPNHQAYNERDVAPGDPYYPDSFLAMPTS